MTSVFSSLCARTLIDFRGVLLVSVDADGRSCTVRPEQEQVKSDRCQLFVWKNPPPVPEWVAVYRVPSALLKYARRDAFIYVLATPLLYNSTEVTSVSNVLEKFKVCCGH